ncbi:MAG: tetratricopeptide repeat protein [Lentisphaerae bacterium]|nr:tetratricopeptide repeat protein [Lentisphaerota bacterium]
MAYFHPHNLVAAVLILIHAVPVLPAATVPLALGVVRQSNGVYLVENHSSAGIVWHLAGQRGATVVHLDAHDDCRFVSQEKLDRLTTLWKQGATDEIFRLSDLGNVSSFKVRPEDTLYDLGNFIYPCISDGTVARLIWVLPDFSLDASARARLQSHLATALHLETPRFTNQPDGSFSFPLLEATMVVTTLDAMQPLPAGALLDIDVDFFAFDRALTDIHLKGDLQWDPELVCTRLATLVPSPAITTISASVYGGYLPLLFRFIADACFDEFASDSYPPYARRHLDAILTMRRTAAPVALPPPPEDPTYCPAHRHLEGLLNLMQHEPEKAFALMEAAAREKPIYAKALLDAAEALRHMGQPETASASIDRFEALQGGATTESRAERVHVLRALGRLNEAETMAKVLVAWNPDPHLLLLHGGILVELQRYDEATVIYKHILVQHPQDYLAAYNLGYLEELQGHAERAMALYRQAIALRPAFAAAHENLGYLLARESAFEEARRHLESAIALAPEKTTAWVGLGDVLSVLDQYAQATASYEEVLRLQPEGPEATHARQSLRRLAALTKPAAP